MVGIEGTSGSVTPTTHRASVTQQNKLVVQPEFKNEALDAFERLKTSDPFASADNIFKYDKDPLRWDTLTTGSAGTTHLPNQSTVNLTCGSVSGDKVTFSQRRYNRYQAGRGFSFSLTTVIGSQMNGIIRRWGLFDDNDGIFWELSGTNLFTATRSSTGGSVVDTKVIQSDWNVDPANGSGLSGFNLDVTKNNIYSIDFQWLSAGRTICSVESNNIDQGKTIVQITENVNTIDKPFMKTATLPIRYEQESVGTEVGRAQAEFKAICSTAIIEGGEDPPEFTFGVALDSEQGIGTTEEHVLSIQLSGTFKGIENRMVVLPRLFSASSETKQATFRLLLNADNLSGTLTSVDPNSGMEAIIGSAPFTGGIPLAVVSVPKDAGAVVSLQDIAGLKRVALSLNVSGNVSDTLSVVGKSSTATANIIAGLTWGEIR